MFTGQPVSPIFQSKNELNFNFPENEHFGNPLINTFVTEWDKYENTLRIFNARNRQIYLPDSSQSIYWAWSSDNWDVFANYDWSYRNNYLLLMGRQGKSLKIPIPLDKRNNFLYSEEQDDKLIIYLKQSHSGHYFQLWVFHNGRVLINQCAEPAFYADRTKNQEKPTLAGFRQQAIYEDFCFCETVFAREYPYLSCALIIPKNLFNAKPLETIKNYIQQQDRNRWRGRKTDSHFMEIPLP